MDEEMLAEWLLEEFGVDTPGDLNTAQATKAINGLQRRRNEATPAETKAGDQLGLPV